MSSTIWENHFKPEIRKAGNAFITKDRVNITQSTDTQIQAYVRAASSFKVTLNSESIESDTIFADCNCPQSKKGKVCKHIWAVLATVVEQELDFLESKTDIQKKSSTAVETLVKVKAAASASQEEYKQKQDDYRKAQYQKQKERAKNFKASKKNKDKSQSYPSDVLAALKYFEENGFPLDDSFNKESVATAKKKLANVFHPDKGGSHDETLELIKFSKILLDFL